MRTTKKDLIKAIRGRIKDELEHSDRLMSAGLDSPEECVSYGMARGARWALEWVLEQLT